MVTKDLIANKDLTSTRNVMSLVTTLERDYKSTTITIETAAEQRKANAKSLLGILSLACVKGTDIKVCISDPAHPDQENNASIFIESWFK